MRYILFMVLFNIFAFGCTLCKSEIPTIHTSIQANLSSKSKRFDIVWDFNKAFSDETLGMYDTNQDQTLDSNELKAVQKSLEKYLVQNQYLTYLYRTTPEDNESIEMVEFNASNEKMEYREGRLFYRYTIEAVFTFEGQDEYNIEFLDREMLFNFVMHKFKSDQKCRVMKAQNAITFALSQNDTVITQEHNATQEEIAQEGIMGYLSTQLAELKKKIQATLQTIKTSHSIGAYLWLLAFSFLYGVVHAIGPGHGKSLVASYFLSGNASPSKALSIAAMIGIVHTFSAFIFSFVLYYIVKGLLATYFNDVEMIATKVSAVIIIAIALYLLYQKLRRPKVSNFSTTPHESSCGCSSCNTHSTDIGVVVGAGIIPCPGTVTIFIFTFSLGIYLVGFLSAIFMSLGMSLIIFIMAYLSIKLKHNAIHNSRVKRVIEYASLLFILGLGGVLLIV